MIMLMVIKKGRNVKIMVLGVKKINIIWSYLKKVIRSFKKEFFVLRKWIILRKILTSKGSIRRMME